MSTDTSRQPSTPSTTSAPDPQPARTDDLLASGADAQDGARGYTNQAEPKTLQTGMEGIAESTIKQGKRQGESGKPAVITETLPDNPDQVRSKQDS